MQNPSPINLMTPAESRALGWQAESRDADGHLCTQQRHDSHHLAQVQLTPKGLIYEHPRNDDRRLRTWRILRLRNHDPVSIRPRLR